MSRLMSLAVLVAALCFAGSPFLVTGFNGFEPDQFPVPQNDPAIQPAGYAFAIWGVIYLWLIAGAGYGLIKRHDAYDWQPMRPALLLSLAVGTTWLAVAQASPVAASVLIWVMLVSALVALFKTPDLDRWWGRASVGLYAGWLTAASFVSLGLLTAGYGIAGEVPAALFWLTAALLFAGLVQIALDGSPMYGVAVVWALVGILIANLFGGAGSVAALAALGIVVMSVLAIRAEFIEP